MGRLVFFLVAAFSLTSCLTQQARIVTSASLDKLGRFGSFHPELPQRVDHGKSFIHLNEASLRLSAEGRFWTNFPDTWNKIQNESLSFKTALEAKSILENSSDSLEQFYACYYIAEAYRESGILNTAVDWYLKALQTMDNAVIRLQVSWIYAMEWGKIDEASKLFPKGIGTSFFSSGDRDKWKFLRSRIFYRPIDLKSIGLDNHVSTIALDRDDVWIGTWAGGLARYSMVGDDFSVLLKPSVTIAPVKFVSVTRWFVYVFRDSVFQRYSKVSQTWKEFAYPENWGGLRVQSVLFLNDEDFYVCHLGLGLFEWKAGVWSDLSSYVSSTFLNAIVRNADDYWIGSQDQGLFRWRIGEIAEKIEGGPQNIATMAKLPNGELLLGTFGEGLWSYSQGIWKKELSAPAYFTSSSMQGSQPFFGSLDSGVIVRSKGNWKFENIDTGIPISDVSTLVSWQDKIVWGTPESGLGIWINDEN